MKLILKKKNLRFKQQIQVFEIIDILGSTNESFEVELPNCKNGN